MRSSEEIFELLENLRRWALEELGVELSYAEFGQALEVMKQNAYGAFLYKRAGHLPGNDLVNLINSIKELDGKAQKGRNSSRK